MGTNYYLILNKCACCGRHTEYHIGKKSVGWQFSFHGIVREGEPSVRSWNDWKALLLIGEIFDEYKRSLSTEDFINIVEISRSEKRNHFDACSEDFGDWSKRVKDGMDWKDDEGFSFCSSDFS